MKILVAFLVIFLVGCAKVVPVKINFPEAPEVLLKKCQNLKQIEPKPNRVPISELFKTIVENYSLYYECSNKVDGWNDWYNSMKKIHHEVGK